MNKIARDEMFWNRKVLEFLGIDEQYRKEFLLVQNHTI